MTQQEIQAILVRAFKTFVQTFITVFVLGLTPIISSILSTHNLSGASSALLALVAAAGAAGISAVMNVKIRPQEAK